MPALGDQHRASALTTNPFEPVVPHVNEYTAAEIATLQSRLEKQLGPEYISTRPGAGGGKVHYLAAEKAINLANEVFGFNGWSSQIREVQIDFVDESESGKVSLGLSIIVRVSLRDGTFHEDVGYGHIENCRGKAAAFEKAKKEAATDALKRALRTFGNVLGNCLYDKDYLSRITKIKPGSAKWDVENLHRHHDFVPQQKNPPIGPESKRVMPVLQNGNSVLSNGTDMEDEFGGNLFDEMEDAETHTDDVVLHDGPQARPLVGATNTMNAPPLPPTNQLQRTLPDHQQRQQSVVSHAQGSEAPNRQQNPITHSATTEALINGRGSIPAIRNNSTNNNSTNTPSYQYPSNGQHSHQTTPHRATPPPQPSRALHTDELPQQEGSVGFTSGRAIKDNPLPENAPTIIAGNVPRFNPHTESPSIRKTAGIDHAKSTKVQRDALPASEDGRSLPLVTAAPGQQQQTPRTTSNFVNAASDLARKIGMPPNGGIPSPLANRNAYKPPGPAAGSVKRPFTTTGGVEPRAPLADVSNTVVTPAENDPSKRQRVGDT